MYNYNPYQQNGILKVNGVEGAKQFPVSACSMVALFDINEDVFYIKQADSGGFATVTAYSFKRIEETEEKMPISEFVTRKELKEFKDEIKEELKGMVSNGKQPVYKSGRKQSDADDSTV